MTCSTSNGESESGGAVCSISPDGMSREVSDG